MSGIVQSDREARRGKSVIRISPLATVYDRQHLQTSAVIDRRYSQDTWVDRVNELSSIQKLLAQLLFQIPPRGFFDGAPLRRDGFLFCPPLGAGSDIDVSRQMRNLWPTCADLSFIWFRVWIHRGNYQT